MRKQKTKPAEICFVKNVVQRCLLFVFKIAKPKGWEDNSTTHLHVSITDLMLCFIM